MNEYNYKNLTLEELEKILVDADRSDIIKLLFIAIKNLDDINDRLKSLNRGAS
ncbi:MAG: hypothetical protein GWN62_10880 [Aliifodinibius sp.]|nr:hypothetical protein [Fodinibius sp.]